MISIDAMWRRWRHAAFMGGLGLSALAAMILLLSAYFAGTAPRLPNDLAVLETLRTGDDLAPVRARALDASDVSSNAEASSRRVPSEPNDLSRRPIDISDLPSPAQRIRPTGD
jgi:hypothetical protein